MRQVVNGVMYILSTGCQWRCIPKDLPPRSTVNDYFCLWSYNGTLEKIHDAIYVKCREQAEREASLTACIIDSESVKSTEKGPDVQDRDGGLMVLSTLFGQFPFLKKLFADTAYAGPVFQDGLALAMPGLITEIVRRCDRARGFAVLPQRWIVERTIAWLNRCRRLAKDWENTTTMRSPSYASRPSVSCSESSAILDDVSGRALSYPYHRLVGGSTVPTRLSPASQTDPGDARFAFVVVGALVAVAIAWLGRPTRFALPARAETGLLLACAIDYPVWLYTFGIHRYMLPLEIPCGVVLLVLADWITTGRSRVQLLLVLVILTVVRVHATSWPRLQWQDHWRAIAPDPLTLPGKPLVFLTFVPSAFVAVSLPADARYVDLGCGDINLCGPETTLTRQLREDLNADPPFSLYAVIQDSRPRGYQASWPTECASARNASDSRWRRKCI
jgi:putative transposase